MNATEFMALVLRRLPMPPLKIFFRANSLAGTTNQKINEGKWNKIATCLLQAAAIDAVYLYNNPDGVVMADALKFVSKILDSAVKNRPPEEGRAVAFRRITADSREVRSFRNLDSLLTTLPESDMICSAVVPCWWEEEI